MDWIEARGNAKMTARSHCFIASLLYCRNIGGINYQSANVKVVNSLKTKKTITQTPPNSFIKLHFSPHPDL